MSHENSLYYFLIVLGGIVVCSYLFDLLARKVRLPSVLLLIIIGFVVRILCTHFQIDLPIDTILPVIGTIGLILIVLEGTMELQITRDSVPTILRSIGCAVFILFLTALTVAGIFSVLLDQTFKNTLLNALPFAVISSAIAIPSAALLPQIKKEFIIYESAISDIIGIVVFSVLIQSITMSVAALWSLIPSLLVTIIAAAISIVLLFVIIVKNQHHIKFFLILSSLIVIYGLTKLLHLPSLLVIFLFGLFFANANQILLRLKISKFIRNHQVKIEIRSLKMIISESAFLIRTFFFVLFGYSINFANFSIGSVLIGILITSVIILVRYIYLKTFVKIHLFPEIFIAPRGLVTVLLFYSIPSTLLIPGITQETLLVVILLTSLLMTISLILYRPEQQGNSIETISEKSIQTSEV